MNKLKKLSNLFNKSNYSFFNKILSRKKKIISIWNKGISPKKKKKSNIIYNKNSKKFQTALSNFFSYKNKLKNKINFLRKIRNIKILKDFYLNNNYNPKRLGNNFNIKYLKKYLEKNPESQFSKLFYKIFKNYSYKDLSKKDNFVIDFLGINYVDHKLSMIHLQKKDNTNFIKDFVNIDVPGDLIGDFKVEKVSELKRIIEDVINIFELDNPPIILLLGPSFFTVRSFSDNELMVFSEEDPTLLSKSPFLPINTLVQYKRVNGDKKSSYHRVIYAEKDAIDSWINVISLINARIATVSSSSINLIEKIDEVSDSEHSILCDIEENSSTIFIIRNQCELDSTKLPFGSSIYISNEESLNKQFFSRLDNSISTILKNKKIKFNGNIFIHGNGIDRMFAINDYIDDKFKILTSYKYKINPNKDLNLTNHKSILNSFSNILDSLNK